MSLPEEAPMTSHESKVIELIASYRTVNERHPLVDFLCSDPDSNNFFHETLNHDAFMISKRSQNIEDGEISIYQKAFLILSDNQPQDYNAAVAIWTDELFGFRAMPSEMGSLDILADLTAKVHAVHRMRNLLEAHTPEGYTSEDGELAVEDTAEDQMMILSQETDSHKEVHESPSNIEQGILPDKSAGTGSPKPFANDLNFQRLLETYHKARRDFDNAIPRSKDRTAAARFLRDTSENCLSYLMRKKRESFMEALTESSMEEIIVDKAVVRELGDTVAETIAFVEGRSGGKKRSFDEGNPTDSSTSSMTTQSKSTSPKKKRRPRIKLITTNSKTARTPIRTHHIARQQAPSPENLRLGRHEVTRPQDRSTDSRSPQSHIHDHRWESHHAVQRREMETSDHFGDGLGRHRYRFDTTSRRDYASGRFERNISEGGYPSYGFEHEYDREKCFERGSAYHSEYHERGSEYHERGSEYHERGSEYHERGSEYHEMASGRSAPRAPDIYRPNYYY